MTDDQWMQEALVIAHCHCHWSFGFMPDFLEVCPTSAVPDPGKQTLAIADRMVVLVHVGGEWFCLDDVCTHDGGPLGEGPLADHTLACPRHGAKFDVRSGKALTMPATQPTVAHDVKIEGDDLLVRLND